MADPRHAVVLAGGMGTRLRPYTTSLPKPLVPIAGQHPILEIVLRQLAAAGFDGVTLAIGHLGGLIQDAIGDGSRFGLAVDYATETEPLGTIGPVVQIRDRLPGHFLVLNGDVLTDLDFAKVLADHAQREAPLTIAAFERIVETEFGVLEVDGNEVVGFTEKPTLRYLVSMGVYGMSQSTIEPYTPGQPIGFDELVLDLLGRGRHPRTWPHSGYWLDIGRPEDYERANVEWAEMRPVLLPAD
jgi:NDP-sugar pyrophosphorylase family protein